MSLKSYLCNAIALVFFILLAVLFFYHQQLKIAKLKYGVIEVQNTELLQKHVADLKVIKIQKILANNREMQNALLQEKSQKLQAINQVRQQKTHKVHHEAINQHWADTALPADIIRLRDRPFIATTRDYRQYMQRTNPLCAQPCNASE